MENLKALSFIPLQNSGKKTLLSVGNFCEVISDNSFRLLTNIGYVKKTKEELEKDRWEIIDFNEIDVRGSLWKYFKQNNLSSDIELIKDETLTEDNSLFYNDNGFFRIPLLLKTTTNKIFYNFYLEN
jgi:hypothetical protein